eukprot:CAMPEP_0198221004 /NCGR_PEP_ID=MMETSP1445-20131203/81767_1 /TAXON_ID=36898 /ORGANISM="Pyramimonas sp., Strain CCMP2087" /LENGTH=402 /DNA_ID=CAMNT_0043898969 /DNA_START=97 /DNA_END=1305 /DNA_ORIENTATION=+
MEKFFSALRRCTNKHTSSVTDGNSLCRHLQSSGFHHPTKLRALGARSALRKIPLAFQLQRGLSSSGSADRPESLLHNQPNSQRVRSHGSALTQAVYDAPTLSHVLKSRGVTDEQFALILKRNPDIVNYSISNEIIPRLNYMDYLYEKGEFHGESVVDYVCRQPTCLEQRFEEIYSDERYIAIRKPYYTRHDTPRGRGRPAYEAQYDGDTSAEEWLQARYPDAYLRFCHQIDFATEGVLLAAVTQSAAAEVCKNFEKHRNKKQYLALVFGHPQADRWTVDAPITKDQHCPKGFKMKIAEDGEDGKQSQTQIEVLVRGHIALEGPHKGKPASKVLIRPLSGRRHQIRLHLQKSGHSIIGDNAYSDDRDSHRMFLLAHRLYVPLKDRSLDLAVPEPAAWERALSQ